MTDLVATMPFAVGLGVEVVLAESAQVIGTMPWTPEVTTLGGAMHGGALMAFADSLGAICAFLNLPEGAAGTSTTSSSTAFLRGVRAGVVTGTSRPLHAGRSTVVVSTELRDDAGRLVAQVTQTQAVLAS